MLDAAGIAAMALVLVHFAGSQMRQGPLALSKIEWAILALIESGVLAGAACLVLQGQTGTGRRQTSKTVKIQREELGKKDGKPAKK